MRRARAHRRPSRTCHCLSRRNEPAYARARARERHAAKSGFPNRIQDGSSSFQFSPRTGRRLKSRRQQRCRSSAAMRAVLLEKIQFSARGIFNAVLTLGMMATQVSLGYCTLVRKKSPFDVIQPKKISARQWWCRVISSAIPYRLTRKVVNPEEPIVFAVDDDASMREALARLFRSIGMRAQLFASAQDFFGFKRPDAPACLVLDVRLPD